MLSEFTTVDGLYVTTHWRVLPDLKEVFLHQNLVCSCFSWFTRNNTSEQAYISGVFKKFTIYELALHLGKHLPEDWQECDRHVDWTPNKNRHPSESWLRHMWEFICSEQSETPDDKFLLKPLEEWPLFPTTSGKLVPPALSKTLLVLYDFCDSDNRAKVVNVLRKLGVPEVSMKHMPLPSATLTELLKKHLALPSKPENVADVIEFMLKAGGEIGKLSLSDCETLLHNFQEGYEALSEDSLQTIKKLPIFRLPSDSLTDLLCFQHYHTIEGYKLLTVEAETWMEHMNCVFLQPCRLLTLIYDQLGISPITHADIYLKYIFPGFHLLSLEARLEHLKCIKDVVLHASEENQQAILESLSHIPFIPDGTNTLQTASFFFDPANPVFKAMVDPNKLLPTSFRLLTDFLLRIGLQTVVSQELYFKFAKEVEIRASRVNDDNELEKLFGISKLLAKELDFNERLRDPTFLQKIAKIKFIPSVPIRQELIDIHPAFTGSDGQDKLPFIAYHGSIPEQYLELVWSVAMLLPHWAIPSNVQIKKDVNMHDCLGIETRVIIDKALSHIQNVCGHMEEKNAIHKKDTLSTKVRGR